VLPPAAHPQGEKKSGRGRMLLAGLAIGAILGGGSGAAVASWLDDDAPASEQGVQSSLVQSNGAPSGSSDASLSGVEAVADQVLPSVVSITVGGQMGASGTGTGVIISSDGEILTNNHVVQAGGPSGMLQVTFNDGTTADAEVVGTDPMTDLAVIKAQDVDGLTPAALGNSSELAVGEQVVAIGSPLGLDGTVTSGIISALQRPIITGEDQDSQTFIDAIQTDAPINRGNSGGPLVNMAGEVVGVNSAIATSGMDTGSIGLGFSIPIDQARPIAEELLETGSATHARIGIGVDSPRDGSRGAVVRQVESGGSADQAGLQEGDIITKINDRVVTDHISLIAAARSYRPGDEVTLTYLRDGEEHTAQVTLGSDAQTT
jgi:putative serine protease PepD